MADGAKSAGTDIGTGWIHVVPTFKGFKGAVYKALGGSAKFGSIKFGEGVFAEFVKAAAGAAKSSVDIFAGVSAGVGKAFAGSKLGKKLLDVLPVERFQQAAKRIATGFDFATHSVTDFIAGFRSAEAAGSAFTGSMGTLGGKVRGVFDSIAGSKFVAPIISKFQGITSGIGKAFSGLGSIVAPHLPVFKAAFGRMADIAKAGAAKTAEVLRAGFKAAAGIASAAIVGLGAVIGANLGRAISRADTLNNFPKVMRNLGYSTEDAKASISKLSEKLDGLPTTLDGMAGAVQRIAPLTSSLDEATNISLALNNALLAGGKSAVEQSNALEQYTQMLSVGKVDMMAWRTMVSAMPGQMNQLAKSLLGAAANSTDLYNAMQSGQVSFDDFNQALLKLNSEGLDGFASFEAQAKDATGGIRTSLENLANSVGKNLAKVFEAIGIENIARPINALKGVIDGVGGAVARMVENLKGSSGGVEQFRSVLAGVAPFLGVAVAAFAGLAAHLPIVGGMFAGITAPIGLAVGLFAGMVANSEKLRAAFAGAGQAIGQAVQPLAGYFVPVLDQLGRLLGQAGDALAPLVSLIGDGLAAAVSTLAPVLADIASRVIGGLSGVMPAISQGVSRLAQVLGQIGQTVLPVVAGALSFLAPVLGVAAQGIGQLIAVALNLAAAIGEKLQPVIAFLGQVVNAVFPVIASVVQAAIKTVVGIVQAGANILKGDWSGAWQAMQGALGNALAGIKNLLGGVWGIVTGAFRGAGSWLVESGKALMQGFVDGIIRMGQAVANAVGGVLQKARNLFPFSPAKEGPFSGRGWVKYSGESIMAGLAEGINLKAGLVKDSISNAMVAAQGALGGNLASPSVAGLGGKTASGAGSAYLPSRVTLVAEDGTMLGVFKTVADRAVGQAVADATSPALLSRLGG